MEITEEQLKAYCDQARAYGFEIGKGKELRPVVMSSKDNPFVHSDWDKELNEEQAPAAAGEVPPPPPSAASSVTSPDVASPAQRTDALRGQPVARHTDPATAHDAANVAKSNAAHNRLKVLLAHYEAGERGLTGDELEQATGLPYETLGPRRPALEADGLIVATGTRRPNRRGNMQAVYRITEAGRVVAERAVA